MMLKITVILLLGFTVTGLNAQNLFKEVEMGEKIHGDWVADWSLKNEKEDPSKEYTIYRFDENDTLYMISDEKVAYKYPYSFYEYEDTVYFSTGSQGINIESKKHFEAMYAYYNIFKFEEDSFAMLRGHNRKKNTFYKSKSQTIPQSEYAKELKGNKYQIVDFYSCGVISSHTVYDFHFISDSNCVVSNWTITTAPKRKEELMSVDTLAFEVIGDTLRIEKKESLFFDTQRQIKQRIGVTKNRLLIQGLKETKK